MGYLALASSVLSLAGLAKAGSLHDIKHVVLFMQENRAFDHVSSSRSLSLDLKMVTNKQYFGTMPGVRGFADPNVQVNPDGRNTFQQ
jgi:phospholipase C